MFFGNIDPEILRRQRRRFRRAQAQQQAQINPRLMKFLPILNLLPILLMSLSYFIPYIFRTKELYVFEKNNKDYPYEKKTRRYKINYYVGNAFQDKYKNLRDNLEIRKIETEIENKYLTYLKIECQERQQLREEIKYKMIYYGKGTYYYRILNKELEKIDFSVCEKLKKYITKINSNEDDEEPDDYDTDDD